ncbi:MAG: hypothetical protein ACRD4X_12325 [Candidatus Acidiferrales bacterium]
MPVPADVGSLPFWLTILGIGGTLAGLLVGFGLNELSSVIRTSREDRRTIGKALAELLEVRHHLKTLPLAIESLKASLPGPIAAHDEFMLRKAIWFFLPNTEGLQKRYEDAVSAVAGEFPTVGDTLIAKTQDTSRPFKGGPIKEIQRDHVQFNTIDGGPGVQIGMLVEFGAKDNQEFYFLSATK